MFKTILKELGGIRKRTVKLIRIRTLIYNFTLKVRIYLSIINYTSASYSAVLFNQRYLLNPINKN